MRNHPKLAEKLVLLYELNLNSAIKTNVDLASALGVTKQSISKWTRGTPTRHGDKLPLAKVQPISELFAIDSSWWGLGYDEFQVNVRNVVSSKKAQQQTKPEDISLSLLPITNAEVFGREAEISFLSTLSRDASVNVVQLTGFGGVGKSTSVNAWLSVLAKENYLDFSRIYAWSFYWQGASSDIKSSGDFFIEHALNWFADPNPIEGTPWGKAARLVKLIRASKALILLDGLEPLQNGPGPKFGQIDNPAVALLVKELACENPGLCVLTSRLPITDLASFEGDRVRSKSVEQLAYSSSESLLKSLGVYGSRDDFKKAIAAYSGHALSLSLLAGYLRVVHQGDLSKFRELNSLLDNKTEGGHARNLLQAYVDWFADTIEQELLFLVGLFDRGVSLNELQNLCRRSQIEGLTLQLSNASQADWMYAIQQLVESRIITKDSRRGDLVLDCHPIVRDFISETMKFNFNSIWLKGNAAIFEHLQNIAVEDPQNMTELEPLFRAVIHGSRAGLYDESFLVYFSRIKKGQFSIFAQGSHYADQACIKSFFRNNSITDEILLVGDAKYYILSSAATNLIYLGEIDKSIELSLRSISWYVSESKWVNAVGIAAPLVSMLIVGGRLSEALDLIYELEECVNQTDNEVIVAMATNFIAYIKFLRGEVGDSKLLFEKAEATITKPQPSCTVHFPTVSAYYCKFLLDTVGSEIALERALKTQSWRKNKTWQVAVDTTSLLASDLIVLGSIFLERGDLVNARKHLERQVELLRSADEWLYLPSGLNSRAMYYIRVKDYESAAVDLNEAIAISNRTGAVFETWESYLNFAQLHVAQCDWESASFYLEEAKSLEPMSVYKYRQTEIDQLTQILEKHNAILN